MLRPSVGLKQSSKMPGKIVVYIKKKIATELVEFRKELVAGLTRAKGRAYKVCSAQSSGNIEAVVMQQSRSTLMSYGAISILGML